MKKTTLITAFLVVMLCGIQTTSASKSSLTNAEFATLILDASGFNPETVTEINYPYLDVPSDLAKYTEKFTQLGYIKYDEDKLFKPYAKVSLPKALETILRYKNIPIYSEVQDEVQFKKNFNNINPKSAYAPIFEIAYEESFFKPNKNTVNFFAPVSEEFVLNLISENKSSKISNTPRSKNYDVFLDVWDKIKNDYLFSNEVDDEELIYAAIDGMVKSLNDKYSNFKLPADAQVFLDQLDNDIEGIGASFIINSQNEIEIVTPLKSSPAEKAGLKPKDIIYKIDDELVKGLDLQSVGKLLKGKSGTKVKINYLRENVEYSVTITRAKVQIPSISAEISSNQILVVTINSFGATTETSFKNIIKKVNPEKVNGVIIDVRKNPGGYVSAAIDIASHFVPKDEILAQVKYAHNKIEYEYSDGYGEFINVPLVVLIDDGSASAAEILASALDEKANAKIVGSQSFGKGTVQEIFKYSDKSLLKITVANWLTPSGKVIDKIGIKPDISITSKSKDQQLNNDAVMNKAFSLLSV